jgi:peptidoglycan/xylan/chitin deacetylase (PgdA/CDA1 family)
MPDKYIHPLGTASIENANGPADDASRCMNISTHNSGSIPEGYDVILSPFGGPFIAGLIPPTAGITYKTISPITISPESGDDCVLINKNGIEFDGTLGRILADAGLLLKYGFRIDGASDVVIRNSKAIRAKTTVDGGDGFNVSTSGAVVSFYNIEAEDCEDEGLTAHAGTEYILDGGIFRRCGNSGIANVGDTCKSVNRNVLVEDTGEGWPSGLGHSIRIDNNGIHDFFDVEVIGGVNGFRLNNAPTVRIIQSIIRDVSGNGVYGVSAEAANILLAFFKILNASGHGIYTNTSNIWKILNGIVYGIKGASKHGCYTFAGTIITRNVYAGNIENGNAFLKGAGATVTASHNAWSGTISGWPNGSTDIANTHTPEQIFTNPSQDDFSLLSGSPLSKKGTLVSVARTADLTDLNNQLITDQYGQVVRKTIDIGAYQSQETFSRIEMPKSHTSKEYTLIQDFDTLGELTIGGTPTIGEISTERFLTGTASCKISAAAGGPATVDFSLPNIQFGRINPVCGVLKTFLPDGSNITALSIYLSTDPNFGAGTWVSATINNNEGVRDQVTFKSGWNNILFNRSSFTGGTPTLLDNYANIFKVVRIRVEASKGPIYYDSFHFGGPCRAKVLVMFDDAHKSIMEVNDSVFGTGKSAFDYMMDRGIKGTIYVASDLTNTADTLTTQQLRTAYNAGWDLANHTKTHVNVTTITEAQIIEEVNACDLFLLSNGFTKARKHFAYPTGAFTLDVHPTLFKNLGFLTARSIQGTLLNTQFNTENLHYLWAKGVGSTVTAANITDKIDEAIKNGQMFGTYIHQLGTPETSYIWDPAKLKTVIDHIVTKRNQGLLDVVTVSEWYNGLKGSRRSI